MKNYQRTVKATPAGGWNVAVTFEDGSKGTFDFSPFVDYPCYAPIREKGVFERVVADHGTLMWPGEIDIAPEAVWAGAQVAAV